MKIVSWILAAISRRIVNGNVVVVYDWSFELNCTYHIHIHSPVLAPSWRMVTIKIPHCNSSATGVLWTGMGRHTQRWSLDLEPNVRQLVPSFWTILLSAREEWNLRLAASAWKSWKIFDRNRHSLFFSLSFSFTFMGKVTAYYCRYARKEDSWNLRIS